MCVFKKYSRALWCVTVIPATQKAGAGDGLSTEIVGQPAQHSETLYQTNKKLCYVSTSHCWL
jgi:hypothetical protein